MTLRLDQATVGYNDQIVLDELSFTVPPGCFTAVIGPNGCGKSTMLKALSRTLPVRAGATTLDDVALGQLRSRAVARRLALLPQHPVVPDGITVRALVARGRHPYHSPLRQRASGDQEAVDSAMAATGVSEVADRPVTGLSGGLRQRVWIAMILAQNTEYVLLDEPTSFLDLAHQIDVLHLCQDMAASGRTVVAVLHDLNQAARYADQVVVMDSGRIVAEGEPAQVIDTALVQRVFGLAAAISADPQTGDPMVIPLRRD